MDSVGRYTRGKNTGLPLLHSMWYSWWGAVIPGCVWESTYLEKWCVALALPPPVSWVRRAESIQQMIMIFRQRGDGWACVEYFICFNGLRKRSTMSGSTEAKHGLSLQTSSFENKVWRGGGKGGGQTRQPHTWQGPTWAAVQCLFTVSDSNRGST